MLSEEVQIDRPVSFLVAALGEEQARELGSGRSLAAVDRESIQASGTRLELVPRGVGRLEVSAPNRS